MNLKLKLLNIVIVGLQSFHRLNFVLKFRFIGDNNFRKRREMKQYTGVNSLRLPMQYRSVVI